MIIFSCLKKEFELYVKKGIISNKVYDAYKEKIGRKTKLNQIKAWANSLPMMAPLIKDLPNNVGITIEFNIPLTSKRVDFVISGYNKDYKPVLILIELKQWDAVCNIKNEDAVVKTVISNKEKITLHPSYQVFCYAELLKNYNNYVEENNVLVIPFVYLHNYDLKDNDELFLNKFKKYYLKAPMYGKNDKSLLKEKINSFICYGDNLEVINNTDKSKNKANKRLLDSIEKMINDKKEYILLDEQKVIAEAIIKEAKKAFTNNQKKLLLLKVDLVQVSQF